ncbi:Guanine nucleotide-binding protein, beta subunit [Parasponia andersonii]|uniref:Guanine nucleotide-binding protein, beta subunit n=1 Tax=Parasponia andersonii TaxID=3476 RepID=A0A2P5AYJ7_PARAD|nr:Guanine nucleotide-binding protein, beta subunit [Parasponia andersonii]
MEFANSQSLFQDVRLRELNGFRVRKRLYIGDAASRFREIGAVAVEHGGDVTPPLAVSFCKSSKSSYILAVSDEDGYVSLFDTRRHFPSSSSHQENAEKSRVCEWVAHHNAVFDVCWVKEGTQILTASGDQTMKVWDVQEKKCVAVLMGHTGSVKSMSPHPTNAEIIVSGSRDGSFALWDMRCNSSSISRHEELCISSTASVKGAHLSPQAKRVRRGKTASMSITSVLYLKDEVSIATAGAVDSIIKFWDTRNMKNAVIQTYPHPDSTEKEKRLHGISSLSQDLNGLFISASCMDNRIYLYNVLQLEKGPVKSFSGCRIESFFVKSSISPDATRILGGSSDGNAYIWQVNRPQEDPARSKSHDGEVTAVDWCPYEDGKIATSSDDFTVRIWNSQSSCRSSTNSPSAIRRRVMALPGSECRKLLMNESMHLSKDSTSQFTDEASSMNPIATPNLSTPEAQEKKFSSDFDLNEIFEKTPETAIKSPSSVLNPPSSLKRKTILDYFPTPM